MDRSPDDHRCEQEQRAGRTISGIHDPGEDAEGRLRCHRVHAGERNRGTVDVGRAAEGAALGRRRKLSKTYLLLAKRAPAGQVHRDLERSQSFAVTTTLLTVRDIRKRFGAREVLRGVSLDVAEGEFLTVLGESGSGKTTLLRLIAGFEQTDAGEIVIAGERIEQLPPYRRAVNTVFQQYALFPHMNVTENVAYGLRVTKVVKAEAMDRAAEALAQVKMTDFADASPSKLSGGQQQRVALARALVNRPKLLLLDEPLSALDANLRRQMQAELKSLQREVGISFIFVTHDQDEAMALSDRIALLRDGVLEQIATPREIYNRPSTAYSAAFVGKTNLIRAEVKAGMANAGALRWRSSQDDGSVLFSIRTESIRPANAVPQNGSARFAAKVQQQTFQGATRVLWLECQDGTRFEARIHSGVEVPSNCEFEFDSKDAVLIKQKN